MDSTSAILVSGLVSVFIGEKWLTCPAAGSQTVDVIAGGTISLLGVPSFPPFLLVEAMFSDTLCGDFSWGRVLRFRMDLQSRAVLLPGCFVKMVLVPVYLVLV